MEENNSLIMDIETPREKKPRVLKRIKKKKPDLNVSSSSSKKKKAFSYGRSNISLSTSIQKQSLRANNKALAFNLERSREALRFANDANLELQRNNQELHMKFTTLERVAGLKNEDIESEVNARLKKHMSNLRTKMIGMRRLFYDAFACMDEVTDMCNLLSRHSTGSHRHSSLGSSASDTSMSQGALEGHCRSLFSQILKAGFPLPNQEESGSGLTPGINHDMSMIAETSVLLDDITPPNELIEQIADIEEADNESVEPLKQPFLDDKTGDNSVKMAPQRVLKQKSRDSPSVHDSKRRSASMEKVDVQAGSPAVTSKRLDRRGTFVINTIRTSDNSPSRAMISKKHASEMEGEGAGKPAKTSSQTTKDQPHRETAGGSDSSSKLNKLSLSLKPSSSVIGAMEGSRSPNVTSKTGSRSPNVASKTRSRSKGRLHKPVVTVTECTDSSNVHDRRKTFVVPAVEQVKTSCKPSTSKSAECLSVDRVEETADDRRRTFLLPPTLSKSANNLRLSPGLVGNSEDVTQCFSMDMEMTEVIDSTQLIQLENSVENRSKEIVATGTSETESGKGIPKASKPGNESITLLTNSSDSSDNETLNKPASVEFRIPRPGKIVFSASRKEMDGSRKPVPSKLPLKARSKSKIKLSRSKGRKDVVPESPKELKSIFDFHDRTPRAKDDTSTKKTGSVYDLSMNESLRDNVSKPSLSQFRESCEQELKDKTSAGSKQGNVKMLPDNPVYYEPLKECSPEPPPIVQKRSRSKSRTRKEDVDNGSENRISRARSRNRKREEEDEKTEKDEEVVNVPESRGWSRSKRRPETTEAVASPTPANCKESGSAGIESEAENCRSRGRSHSKRRPETTEAVASPTPANSIESGSAGIESEADNCRSRGRSRSKRRLETTEAVASPTPANSIESGSAGIESEADNCRSRGRSRIKRRPETTEAVASPTPANCKESGSAGIESEAENCKSRGRSRSKRKPETTEAVASPTPANSIESGSAGIESEADNCRSRGRSRSRRRKDTTEADTDSDVKGNEVKQRSRSINRRKDVDSDTDKVSENDGLKSRTRSLSRRRKEQVDEDVVLANDVLATEEQVRKESVCTSTSRSDHERTKARSRSIKRKNDIDDADLVSEKNVLKARTRSRSRRRKEVVENPVVPLEDVVNNSDICESGITSGSRQIGGAHLNTSGSEIEKDNEGHTSTARSLGRPNQDKEDRKSKGRPRKSEFEKENEDSTSRSRSRGRVIQDKKEPNVVDRKSPGRSRSRKRKDTVDPDAVSASQTISKSCTNVEDTPDKEIRKMTSTSEDLIEDERKCAFQRSKSRARSRTRKNKEPTGEGDGADSNHGAQSTVKTAEELPEVVILCSDDDMTVDYLPLTLTTKSQIPTSEVEAVPASSDEDKIGVSAQKSTAKKRNPFKSNVEENKDEEVEIEGSVIILSSPPQVKSKKQLSLQKKNRRKSPDSSDTNTQSITDKPNEDTNMVEEKDISSEKKRKIVACDADEIPRLAEGLFVTKRGRSLKPSKQTLDDQDLFFDFENISSNYNVETNKVRLPRTPSTPAVEGSKTTPKDKTASTKLKKLKSSKKSTNKRRRSNCSSLSEAEQQTSCTSNSSNEAASSTDKENDKPALGFSEQLQNIRKKLVSLDRRQSKVSLGSQPSAGLSNFDFSKLDMGNNEPDNKRQRRGTAQVSYKEVSLMAKMRREDYAVPKSVQKPTSNVSTPVAK